MLIAEANNLGAMHGGRAILTGVSFAINDGEKLGLIGPSGCGKSTLVRILAGLDKPSAGTLTLRRGARVIRLAQEGEVDDGRTALDELLTGDDALAALQTALDACTAALRDQALLDDAERFDALLLEQARLLDEVERRGGHALRNRAEGMLRTLGVEEADWSKPLALLSGGQRKLAGIGRCLLARPDLLLLDEPDNHLDARRKAILERTIREFPGAVLVISHDRYLMDETVDAILEMEPSREGTRLRRWEGNYSAYVAQKEIAQLRQAQDYASQQREIARLEAAVARFKLWARMVVDERHIKQARNKQRQIDTMDKVDRPVLERRRMALQFRPSERGGNKVVELRGVTKAFDRRAVVADGRATVTSGERIGVVGPNGSGKSVLLKLIRGEIRPDSGEIWAGPSIRLGYYSQQHETLDLDQTPVAAIRGVKPMTEAEAVAALTRFLLPYDTLNQPMARLSGGEKSRVQLACLMRMGANCLLLDEPTNHLDIAAAEVLEAAIEGFSGTAIIVSHDRYLLDRLVDRIFEVDGGRLRVFEGGFSAYAAAKAQFATPPPARSAERTAAVTAPPTGRKPTVDRLR